MIEIPIALLFDLTGKTALVTGGGRGIGRGIVLRLSEAGAAVVISDIDADLADGTAQEIQSRGGKALGIKGDVSLLEDVERVTQSVVDAYGGLDILVNNAAYFPTSPTLQLSEETWNKVIDTNLKGVFFHSKFAIKKMIEQGRGGKIINITSIHSFRPYPDNIHYCASKSGIVLITKTLAVEFGQYNICVNAIAPGWIQTPGAEDTAKEMQEKFNWSREDIEEDREVFRRRVLLGRLGVSDDIARVALFLASEASSYITGTEIVVDGGFVLS